MILARNLYLAPSLLGQFSEAGACSRVPSLYPLWLLMATTGVRRGEAPGLRWQDVNLDKARRYRRRRLGGSLR